MATIKTSAVFPYSRTIVWDELRLIERHVSWMTDALRIDFSTDQREGVGTSFVCVTKVGPFVTRDKMTITEWNEQQSMGVTHVGIVTGRGLFTLSDTDGGTSIQWSETLQFPWFALGPLGAWCAKPVLTMLWKKNLSNFGAQLAK